jgi:phthiocerol/phenolphthiocerol synthesis type-I polyketide synthase C
LPASQAPKFYDLARSVMGERGALGTEAAPELRRRLDGLTGMALTTALTEIVRCEVAEILRMAPERIEAATSLLDMGMDSLMAVELATSIEARLDIQLSALALSSGPTIENVVERIVRLLRPSEQSVAADAGRDAHVAQALDVAARHMGDLSAENAAEFSAGIGAAGAPRPLTAGHRP